MTIASEISNLQTNLQNSYESIETKGGTLPSVQNFDNLATAISSIPSSGSGEKYGANGNTFLGNIDANGILQLPTEQSDLVFTGVKDVANYGLYYKFVRSKIKSASFPDLTTISGSTACDHMFTDCSELTSVSFPNLTTISGSYACYFMFANCSELTSVSLPNLTTISGQIACIFMFAYCSRLTSVSFPSLTTISEPNACHNMFSGSIRITDIYFPALTTSSFGSYTKQFTDMMAGTSTSITHTLHFPSNLESTISGLDGYPLFGGISGYVVCAFDLPATS